MINPSYTFRLPYRVRLTDEQIRRLGKLANLYNLSERECIARLIDREWDERRPLIEHMEAEK